MLSSILSKKSNPSFYTTRYYRMTFNRLFAPTRRDSPSDAVINSHKLLIRGGYIRMTNGRGLFTFLPLANRVITKIEAIIDEELQSINCQKLCMPIVLLADDWKTTNRWNTNGDELFKLKDRHSNNYLLAPTHEECVTSLVANEISSYKQLPLRLYQIGKKFRDEMRPRFGLLRSREFIMKDLYTFDNTIEEAYKTYDEISDAYFKIFRRMGLDVVRVDADSGNIGGDKSHEFQIISNQGFDDLLKCVKCNYAANIEKAVSLHSNPSTVIESAIGKLFSSLFNIKLPNTVSYTVVAPNHHDSKFSIVATSAGREIQPLLVKSALGWDDIILLPELDLDSKINSMLAVNVPICIDSNCQELFDLKSLSKYPTVTTKVGHFALAQAGDKCAAKDCNGNLQAVKGVEVGHIFYLGKKYSKLLNAIVDDSRSLKKVIEMGCFGIGVTRLLSAAVETSHDNDGIIWPIQIAPYRASIITGGMPEHLPKCEELYDSLNSIPGFKNEIILDDRDRDTRMPVKIKDSLLMGFPYLIIGGKGLNEGKFELQVRKTGEKLMLSKDEIIYKFSNMKII